MAEAKPKPQWAQPVHFVVATACGDARRGHRLSRDPREITCRFCKLAMQQQAEDERKGRAPSRQAAGSDRRIDAAKKS
jgi:hypothetical protein